MVIKEFLLVAVRSFSMSKMHPRTTMKNQSILLRSFMKLMKNRQFSDRPRRRLKWLKMKCSSQEFLLTKPPTGKQKKISFHWFPQIPKRKPAARSKVDNWNTSNVTSYLSNSRSTATLSKTDYKSRSTISHTSLSEVKRNPSTSYLIPDLISSNWIWLLNEANGRVKDCRSIRS
jgi:hypothetical protein